MNQENEEKWVEKLLVGSEDKLFSHIFTRSKIIKEFSQSFFGIGS
jgi:hypothetical protein